MSKPVFRILAAALAAGGLQLHAVTPEAAVSAALVPGADFFAYANSAKIQNSPFVKHIENLAKSESPVPIEALLETPQFAPFKSAIDKFTGNSLKQASASGVFTSLASYSFDNNGLLVCLVFEKPVDKAALRELVTAFGKFAGEAIDSIPNADKNVTDFFGRVKNRLQLSDLTHGGATGINVAYKLLNDPDDPVLSLALLADNKVLYVGFEQTVKAAIDRANDGKQAPVSKKFASLFAPNFGGARFAQYDACGIFVIPVALRYLIAEIEPAIADQIPPGFQSAANAVKGLQGWRFAYACGDKLDVAFSVLLNDPGRASALKEFLEINFIGLAKAQLFQFAGKNTAFAESLAANATANATSIQFTVTTADIDFFVELAKKQLGDTPLPFFNDEDDGE